MKLKRLQKDVNEILDYIMYDLPPGPPCLKLCYVINMQKCMMLPYLVCLQWYFGNYSHEMSIYTCLHGSYGILWYMKHLTFPDESFERHMTVSAAVVAWLGILGPYMVPGYLIDVVTASI